MYVVISFDFGGTSEVRMHCMTSSVEVGREVYAQVHKAYEQEGFERLIELVEVDEGFNSSEGLMLFWGRDEPGTRTLLSNNKNGLCGTFTYR